MQITSHQSAKFLVFMPYDKFANPTMLSSASAYLPCKVGAKWVHRTGLHPFLQFNSLTGGNALKVDQPIPNTGLDKPIVGTFCIVMFTLHHS